MLVLLGISTGIAIVTPAPNDDPAPETSPTTGVTGVTGAGGSDSSSPGNTDLVKATVSADDDSKTVKASPGDRLVLTVDPGRASDLEIPDLGLTGTTTPYAPVTFDVQLPAEPGQFEVIEATGRKLAVIETSD